MILRLKSQDVDKGGDLFSHRYGCVHVVFLQKRCFLSVHYEDDSGNQNGSVEQKKEEYLLWTRLKRKEKPGQARENLCAWGRGIYRERTSR
jgi:hypothetical protein